MAVGAISSPTQWLLRTVFTHTWGQAVQDNINALFSQTYTRWIGTEAGSATADWTLTPGTAGDYMTWVYDGSGAADLTLTLPMFYGTSTKDRVSSVAVKIYKDGGATTTVTVYKMTGLNTTGTPGLTSLGSATSTTSGYQLISVSGLTASPAADEMLVVTVGGGDANDKVYGARIAYSLVTA